jgi:hypothetical protein
MRSFSLVALLLSVLAIAAPGAQSRKFVGAPETFNAKASVATDTSRGDVYVTIHVDKYTPEKERDAVVNALQSGGSEGFLEALRKSPVAGKLDVGKQSFPIRWAREERNEKGRVITLVTDRPVYYVGAGLPDAKPRAGFDVAVIQLQMDSAGVGEGSMAAAAKVKPGGATGVEVEDYATAPVKLPSVTRKIQ